MKRKEPVIVVLDDSEDEVPTKRQELDPYAEFESRAYAKLKEVFGFTEFRFPQLEVITSIHEGVDTIGLLPTGFGKSLMYQLGALLLEVNKVGLVISPLVALMQDQTAALEKLGIPCIMISTAHTATKIYNICKELCAPVSSHRLIYVSPERLNSEQFIGVLQCLMRHNRMGFVAVDEAHCISQWSDFRPAYSRIGNIRSLLCNVPFLALTATATPDVKKDIIQQLNLRTPNFYSACLNRPEISYIVRPTISINRDIVLVINDLPENSDVIIYCFSRQNTENIAKHIRNNTRGNRIAKPYHSKLKVSERTALMQEWQQNKVHIICATTAFGMGIDKPSVCMVIHYNPPFSVENFYQESGRGGRDGRSALNLFFYSHGSFNAQRVYIENTSVNPKRMENRLAALDKVEEYCALKTCRRQYLMEFFGQSPNPSTACNNTCDRCDPQLLTKFNAQFSTKVKDQ